MRCGDVRAFACVLSHRIVYEGGLTKSLERSGVLQMGALAAEDEFFGVDEAPGDVFEGGPAVFGGG